MTVLSKVRIYDLAKELKQESKRILEEARREGVDVSVPSNTISKELAEKIRNKYYPKKEATQPRTVRVIKHQRATTETPGDDPSAAEAMPPGDTLAAPPTVIDEPPTGVVTAPPGREPEAPSTGKTFAARLIKKLPPAERATQPAPPTQSAASPATTAPSRQTEGEDMAATSVATATEFAPEAPTPAPETDGSASFTTPGSDQSSTLPEANLAPAPAPPVDPQPTPTVPAQGQPARQVRALRPTTAALNAGIRHGERAPAPVVAAPAAPAAPAPTPRERDRRSGGGGGRDEQRSGARAERSGSAQGRDFPDRTPRGTPGETATPQPVYIPPTGPRGGRGARGGRAGARGGRGGTGAAATRGGARGVDGRGRFERDFIPSHPLTLEGRIAQSLNLPADAGELKSVRLVEGSTVKEFAEKLGIKPKDVVALLLQRGVFATINQTLNADVAKDLARRFGYEITFVDFEEMVTEVEFEELIKTGGDDVEESRAPVVTVMGHVDHGKTSLLDGIRATDVAGGEAGGITQHIGAYKVGVPDPDDPSQIRHIVFLDTPGHEAFTLMRARGAKATDVVVLVVAADDGVMPQTIEAIEHSRAAKVPIVVAINKIDRPDANPDRVKQELSTQGLQPIEWGGDTEMVQVSAKQRKNLDGLLETILLTTDILNLRASKTRLASGVVLEAKLDKGRGSVATVLVQQGTLRVGDPFIIGQIFGKVRAMFNDRGEAITLAEPSTPVEVLGLQGMPQAGEAFQVVADITSAQSISSHRQMLSRQNTLLQTTKRGIEALGEKEVKELLVILKADVQGSVEVLKSTLQKLSTEQVKVKVIRSGVGAITESDVLLASATQAGASSTAVVIIGFNVRPEVRAAELAKQESVDVRLHSIIYKVEEEIRAAMIGMLEAIERERIIGKADVREVFKVPRVGAVAGCMVIDGTIRRNARARLIRDGVVAWEGGIASLRRFKDDASEVRQGFDCGIGLENFNDIKVGDQIEAYIVEKVAATEL